MAKNKRRLFWSRLISIALAFIGVFGLLGAFQITKLGSGIFNFFELLMGNFDWAGPFIALVLSFFFWPSSGSMESKAGKKDRAKPKRESVRKTPKRAAAVEKKKIPIPGGKLVTLKGFNKYFSSPDWTEMDSERTGQESIPELGRDFPSYFGEGKKSIPRLSSKLTALQGMKEYFATVDLEVLGEGLKNSALEETIGETIGENIKEKLNLKEQISIKEESNIKEKTDINNQKINIQENVKIKESLNSEENMIVKEPAAAQALNLSPDIANANLAELVPPKNPHWRLPGPELLESVPPVLVERIPDNSPQQLENLLQEFGIKAKVIRVNKGPVITRYELAPAPGVKISRIVNLADDIALALAAKDVRIEAPIPGKSAIGIEVPNKEPQMVGFKEVIETDFFQNHSSVLKVALGKDIGGQPVVGDLRKMPHLLVAGATGAGKSVCISSIINSVLYNATPAQVKFLLIDPKMVELSLYNGIPHLVVPVITDPKRAAAALKWLVKEMETRYELFAQAGVRDIERYNQVHEGGREAPALPFIVVIIDELADLMLVAGEVEETICRLAQMARAAGIHLVLATQRPSVDVITGLIKANIPSRIAFAVSSQIDSRTILDCSGAEKLMGRGDMLFSPQGLNKPLRVQGCLVKDEEVHRMIKFWQSQGRPEYLEVDFNGQGAAGMSDTGEDDLFGDAARLIITSGMASVSYLQRRLKIGYARAARLMDMLEEHGIVGGYEGSKPRQILISIEEFEERFG